jgi:hypothetical protein
LPACYLNIGNICCGGAFTLRRMPLQRGQLACSVNWRLQALPLALENRVEINGRKKSTMAWQAAIGQAASWRHHRKRHGDNA